MVITLQVGKDVDIYYASDAAKYTGIMNHHYTSGVRIGFANNLTYSIEQNAEAYFAPGRRTPWGIKAGRYECTINIEGLWIDSGAQAFFLKQTLATGALTAFAMGASGTDQAVSFSGCRISSGEVEFDAEGWATNSFEMLALLAK